MYKRFIEFSIKIFGVSISFKHHIELPEPPTPKNPKQIVRIEPTLKLDSIE
jgi:hypothetical protein